MFLEEMERRNEKNLANRRDYIQGIKQLSLKCSHVGNEIVLSPEDLKGRTRVTRGRHAQQFLE